MKFPLSFNDVGLWLAFTSVILLATSELLSSYHGQTDLTIHKKRLRTSAITLGILSTFTILMKVYEIITRARF